MRAAASGLMPFKADKAPGAARYRARRVSYPPSRRGLVRMPSLSRPHAGREEAYLCRAEREANLFAAEFLLSDEAVLPLLSAEGAAETLEVPPELLLMKRIALGEKGMAVPCAEPPAEFLAGICR